MSAAARSPFTSWRKPLRERGFTPASAGGRRGIYMIRRQDALMQAVGAMIHRHREDRFLVVLHVGLPLRGSDPEHDVLLLDADLSETGVRVTDHWTHDPDAITLWPLARPDQAWTAVLEHGLPWLDRNADVAGLIAHFETEFARHEAAARVRETTRIRNWFRRSVIGAAAPAEGHYEYLLWLSLLSEARGDLDGAMGYLDAYDRARPDPGPNERARRERHRRALGQGR